MIAIAPQLMVKTITNKHTLLYNTWSKMIIGLSSTQHRIGKKIY